MSNDYYACTLKEGAYIDDNKIYSIIDKVIDSCDKAPEKTLLLPPDYTRSKSFGGKITAMFYERLKDICSVDIMPAIGTHLPVSEEEIDLFFGKQIPKKCFIEYNWRKDVVRCGEVPAELVNKITEGLFNEPIEISINKGLVEGDYDLIVSIGQIVPHVIAGMANYSKNVLVGCGGEDIINKSHLIGAVYGMENLMGKINNPVRKIFDYAQKEFLDKLKINYILTVTSTTEIGVELEGVFASKSRKAFEEACKLSRSKNIQYLDKPIKHIVAFLDEEEFKSTWLGNKAIYRTRMAIADGGKLTILAPGVKMFGEDEINDSIIRKYGYSGTEKIKNILNTEDMKKCKSAAAHLIHGSTDGRFEVEYAVQNISREEIESVNYSFIDYEEAIKKYDIGVLKQGFNTVNGEEIYFIKNPALGLWASSNR